MTDRIQPSPGTVVDSLEYSGATRFAAGTDGWVVPSGNDKFAVEADEISGAPLNGFVETHSATSMTVTIDSGEGFVHGKWVARDVTTDVTLTASTAGQTVYVGWAPTGTSLVIGLDGDFASNARQYALWDFRTDGSGVVEVTDLRETSYIVEGSNHADTADLAHDSEAVGGVGLSNLIRADQSGTISGDLTVQNSIEIQGEMLHLPNSTGNAGVRFQNGTAYSQYQGWSTVYSYTGLGGNGFRVRNPDGAGDLFNVPADGSDPHVQGNKVYSESNVYYSSTEPSNWEHGDLWLRPI